MTSTTHDGDDRLRRNEHHEGGNASNGNGVGAEGLIGVGAPVRVGRLHDLRATRAELARLYREARRRHGRYPCALDAMRLANILGVLRAHIETDELRERLEALEAREAGRG